MNKRKFSTKVSTPIVLWILLVIAFIVLKYQELIPWSWWWLLFPLLGPLVIAILAIGTVAVCIIFNFVISKK